MLENVFFVEGLKHKLLISQLCNECHKVCFGSNTCEVVCLKWNESKLVGNRAGIVDAVYLDISPSNIENYQLLLLLTTLGYGTIDKDMLVCTFLQNFLKMTSLKD